MSKFQRGYEIASEEGLVALFSAGFAHLSNRLRGQSKVEVQGRIYEDVYLPRRYSPWKNKEFAESYAGVKANTQLPEIRAYGIWESVKQTEHLSGDILEVGVWKGGTGVLMAKRACDLNLNTEVYLCDTFEGVVKSSGRDPGFSGGEYNDTSVAEVASLAEDLSVSEYISIASGIFPEESASQVKSEKFRLCHIDVDTYQSALDVLEFVWPKLETSGMIIFDDYGASSTSGIAKLVDDYKNDEDNIVLYNVAGQAFMIKVS